VQLFSRLLLFSADIFFFTKKKIVEEFLNDYSLHEIRFFVFLSSGRVWIFIGWRPQLAAHRRSCSSSSHHHSIEIQNKLNDCFFPSLQFFFFLLWRPWVVLMCFPGPTKFVFPLRRRKKKFPFCFCFIPYFFSKVKKSIESHRDAVRIVKVYHVVCSRWSVA
jgi:hypothetical protein